MDYLRFDGPMDQPLRVKAFQSTKNILCQDDHHGKCVLVISDECAKVSLRMKIHQDEWRFNVHGCCCSNLHLCLDGYSYEERERERPYEE